MAVDAGSNNLAVVHTQWLPRQRGVTALAIATALNVKCRLGGSCGTVVAGRATIRQRAVVRRKRQSGRAHSRGKLAPNRGGAIVMCGARVVQLWKFADRRKPSGCVVANAAFAEYRWRMSAGRAEREVTIVAAAAGLIEKGVLDPSGDPGCRIVAADAVQLGWNVIDRFGLCMLSVVTPLAGTTRDFGMSGR